jgi:hypothetical protein
MSASDYAAARLEIKITIAAFIKTLAPTALVLKRFVFDPNDDKWPNLLKSPDDNNAIHAIQIFFTSTSRAPNRETPPGCFNPILGIGIGFFRKYEIGTDATNSEDLLDAEVSIVQWSIEQNKTFALPQVAGHEGLLGVNYKMTRPLGQSGQIQYGIGKLDVLMQPQYLR